MHTSDDAQMIESVSSYQEAADAAIAILTRIRESGVDEVYQVCGPISTGGRGSREANMQFFARAIEHALGQGHHLFDQRPFEDVIRRLSPHHTGAVYDTRILTDFYEPIFRSNLVTHLWFLPDWESSRGAQWEREMGTSLNLTIAEYPYLLD